MAYSEELAVRIRAALSDRDDVALARPHARPMDFTGRPLRGFVLVGASGIRTAKR